MAKPRRCDLEGEHPHARACRGCIVGGLCTQCGCLVERYPHATRYQGPTHGGATRCVNGKCLDCCAKHDVHPVDIHQRYR